MKTLADINALLDTMVRARAIDALYDYLDTFVLPYDVAGAEAWLADACTYEASSAMLLSVLASLRPMRADLPSFPRFFEHARALLRARKGDEQGEKCLRGLGPEPDRQEWVPA